MFSFDADLYENEDGLIAYLQLNPEDGDGAKPWLVAYNESPFKQKTFINRAGAVSHLIHKGFKFVRTETFYI